MCDEFSDKKTSPAVDWERKGENSQGRKMIPILRLGTAFFFMIS